jgi:hypothetical protein
MRKLISALWTFSISIWKQRNSELHGTDSALSLERCRQDAATQAVAIYQETLGKNISASNSIILHHHSINAILNWTKEHLDAHLASAAAIIVVRNMGWESYGYS